jgi:hypothetical protein
MFLIRIILGHMRRPRSLGIFKIKFDIFNKSAKVFYMKLQLSNGMDYGIDANGKKICRGAKMGRPNILPTDCNAPIKLRMERLKWIDHDYDIAGCYWGFNGCTDVYCAWADNVRIFVRALGRVEAKERVWELVPNARFFK